MSLFDPLSLPNGQVVKNRIAKAAMEEALAETGQLPGLASQRLYRAWGEGGAGLLITGNVMVAPDALTGPKVWMQINHPGRQVFAALGNPGWAPSVVPLQMGKHGRLFAPVKALSRAQIAGIVQRFADTARQAEAAGFDGVQIHAAHGYLLSQFLSPLSNRRDDEYGGSLENRARLLIEVLRAVRAAVSPGFAIAVKLNSADFQRGGFSERDAQAVVQMLNAERLDLLELSGGSYESPAMQGRTADGRTLAREAYFLEFARQLALGAQMPVMTTGGIRRRAVAQAVRDAGIALVGLGTALAYEPALPRRWQSEEAQVQPIVVGWRDKALASLATMATVRRQLHRLSQGKSPSTRLSPLVSLLLDRLRARRQTRRYRAWHV